jgi:hypothetical protein
MRQCWNTVQPLLWTKQVFAVFFGVKIVQQDSRDHAAGVAKKLLRRLAAAQWSYSVRRHLSCMAGMVVGGVATGGVGAIAAWLYAGGGMVWDGMAQSEVCAGLEKLYTRFPDLRNM